MLADLEAATGMEFFPTLFAGTDDVPVMKEIADAPTDEILRFLGTKKNTDAGGRGMVDGIGSTTGRYVVDNRCDDYGAFVPLSNNGDGGTVVDARRRKRIRPFRHICRNNDGCFKSLRDLAVYYNVRCKIISPPLFDDNRFF